MQDRLKTVPGTVIHIKLFYKHLQNVYCTVISKLYRVQFLLGLYFFGSLLVLGGEESARDWACGDAGVSRFRMKVV
jgi:hypothetical protein